MDHEISSKVNSLQELKLFPQDDFVAANDLLSDSVLSDDNFNLYSRSFSSSMDYASNLKAIGIQCMKNGQYLDAIGEYEKALESLFLHDISCKKIVNESLDILMETNICEDNIKSYSYSSTEIHQMRLLKYALLLNVSYCHQQLGHRYESILACDKAVTLDPMNPKAYFRRCQARLGASPSTTPVGGPSTFGGFMKNSSKTIRDFRDYESALSDARNVIRLDPGNSTAMSYCIQLTEFIRQMRLLPEDFDSMEQISFGCSSSANQINQLSPKLSPLYSMLPNGSAYPLMTSAFINLQSSNPKSINSTVKSGKKYSLDVCDNSCYGYDDIELSSVVRIEIESPMNVPNDISTTVEHEDGVNNHQTNIFSCHKLDDPIDSVNNRSTASDHSDVIHGESCHYKQGRRQRKNSKPIVINSNPLSKSRSSSVDSAISNIENGYVYNRSKKSSSTSISSNSQKINESSSKSPSTNRFNCTKDTFIDFNSMTIKEILIKISDMESLAKSLLSTGEHYQSRIVLEKSKTAREQINKFMQTRLCKTPAEALYELIDKIDFDNITEESLIEAKARNIDLKDSRIRNIMIDLRSEILIAKQAIIKSSGTSPIKHSNIDSLLQSKKSSISLSESVERRYYIEELLTKAIDGVRRRAASTIANRVVKIIEDRVDMKILLQERSKYDDCIPNLRDLSVNVANESSNNKDVSIGWELMGVHEVRLLMLESLREDFLVLENMDRMNSRRNHVVDSQIDILSDSNQLLNSLEIDSAQISVDNGVMCNSLNQKSTKLSCVFPNDQKCLESSKSSSDTNEDDIEICNTLITKYGNHPQFVYALKRVILKQYDDSQLFGAIDMLLLGLTVLSMTLMFIVFLLSWNDIMQTYFPRKSQSRF